MDSAMRDLEQIQERDDDGEGRPLALVALLIVVTITLVFAMGSLVGWSAEEEEVADDPLARLDRAAGLLAEDAEDAVDPDVVPPIDRSDLTFPSALGRVDADRQECQSSDVTVVVGDRRDPDGERVALRLTDEEVPGVDARRGDGPRRAADGRRRHRGRHAVPRTALGPGRGRGQHADGEGDGGQGDGEGAQVSSHGWGGFAMATGIPMRSRGRSATARVWDSLSGKGRGQMPLPVAHS